MSEVSYLFMYAANFCLLTGSVRFVFSIASIVTGTAGGSLWLLITSLGLAAISILGCHLSASQRHVCPEINFAESSFGFEGLVECKMSNQSLDRCLSSFAAADMVSLLGVGLSCMCC